MEPIIVLWSYGMGAAMLLLMLVQYLRGRWDLLTARNFAIVGFVVFQVTSVPPVLWLKTDWYRISDPEEIALQHLLWSTVFFLIAWGVYESGVVARSASKVIRANPRPPPDAVLFPLALLATVAAVLLRYVPVPLIGVLTSMTGVGMAAISTGAIGWLWGRNLFNPALAAIALGLTGVNAFIAMGVGIGDDEFGRRPLIAVAAALVWSLYFSGLRYRKPGTVAAYMAVIGGAGIFAVMVFSTARNLEAFTRIGSITPRQWAERFAEITNGQDTPRRSMWIAERMRDGDFETKHLQTVVYLTTFPIPRAIWSGKPYPLSTYMADYSRRDGVRLGRTGVTNPAGIIGNAAYEGGLYALVVYAILAGLILRFFDQLLIEHETQPMVVLPLGCALGHLIGAARGETSVFVFNYIWTTLSCMFIMLVLLRIVRMLAGQNAAGAFEEYDDEDLADDYDPDAYARGEYDLLDEDSRA